MDKNGEASGLVPEVLHCTRAVAREMLRGDGGAIVNVASVAGLRGWAGQANYAASKAGLIGLTRAVAQELGDRDIRINAVAPGYVRTDLYEEHLESQWEQTAETAHDRPATPEEIASVTTFLASDAASYVNGAVYRADDGLL